MARFLCSELDAFVADFRFSSAISNDKSSLAFSDHKAL